MGKGNIKPQWDDNSSSYCLSRGSSESNFIVPGVLVGSQPEIRNPVVRLARVCVCVTKREDGSPCHHGKFFFSPNATIINIIVI